MFAVLGAVRAAPRNAGIADDADDTAISQRIQDSHHISHDRLEEGLQSVVDPRNNALQPEYLPEGQLEDKLKLLGSENGLNSPSTILKDFFENGKSNYDAHSSNEDSGASKVGTAHFKVNVSTGEKRELSSKETKSNPENMNLKEIGLLESTNTNTENSPTETEPNVMVNLPLTTKHEDLMCPLRERMAYQECGTRMSCESTCTGNQDCTFPYCNMHGRCQCREGKDRRFIGQLYKLLLVPVLQLIKFNINNSFSLLPEIRVMECFFTQIRRTIPI